MIISDIQHRLHLMLFVILLLIVYSSQGNADESCNRLSGNLFDYNDLIAQWPDVYNFSPNVGGLHFKPQVERLESGATSTIMGDLDYILRAIPNHHRALWAVSRYERRFGMKGEYPPAECYFKRAIEFRPNDPAVHLIFGMHLHLSGKLDEALKEYKISEQIFPNSPELYYNMGLLYFDRKEYALAKQHAQKAYQMGYPLPGLRNKLKSIGQWP
jgi:tetratricopeptide (TPR) repeat protein